MAWSVCLTIHGSHFQALPPAPDTTEIMEPCFVVGVMEGARCVVAAAVSVNTGVPTLLVSAAGTTRQSARIVTPEGMVGVYPAGSVPVAVRVAMNRRWFVPRVRSPRLVNVVGTAAEATLLPYTAMTRMMRSPAWVAGAGIVLSVAEERAEVTVVVRFWIGSALLAVLALASLKVR